MESKKWQFWVDRGGTFTDVVALRPDGTPMQMKLLSEAPGQYSDAAAEAIRRLTGAGTGQLPPADLKIGTTVATNALLERKGEPLLLAVTQGLGDVLRIGTQDRPDLFAREIILPEPLYTEVAEITERCTADGTVLISLDLAAAKEAFAAAFEQGLRSVAIVLAHGYRYPAHEQALAQLARETGFTQITTSHEAAPVIRMVPRGDTAVADAYLSPILRRYVAGLQRALGPDVRTLFMQSGGGLADAAEFHGKDAVLSGPAGGIVGMAAVAKAAGLDEVIGFDMGGTSTDVSHWAGQYERDSETQIGGVRIRAPMMRINTVAAGGGSVCSFDGVRLCVGPESAGASPGPACYRGGGPLTVTDCNLLLGKLQPDHFPRVFGAEGNLPLDPDASRQRIDALLGEIAQSGGPRYSCEDAAEGLLSIAVAQMANAIKAISVRRGHDCAAATLVSFGGAGGQHACRVAEALGMRQVLCHPLASVLSAYGIGLAEQSAMREVTMRMALDADAIAPLNATIDRVRAELAEQLAAHSPDGTAIRTQISVLLRPEGTENTIEVPYGTPDAMTAAFDAAWRTRFGFGSDGPLIVESLRVEAIAGQHTRTHAAPALPDQSGGPEKTVRLFSAGAMHDAPVYLREKLADGFTLEGPGLIVDPVSTIVVEPGWSATVGADGVIKLTAHNTRSMAALARTSDEELAPDPIRLEIMGALFMAVAEEMGAALQASARSVNIRERLDFSCAVFDRDGNLTANAPHMPVHLGSMGESVRTIIARRSGGADERGIHDGDAYALNAPYDGGTHLPDITVVMPVFGDDDCASPAWWVAARGHHADIGGIAPGSMPPDSTDIAEEGVLLDNVLLVDKGRLCESEVRALLESGPWPARNPGRNIEDLRAQLAACARGAAQLRRMAAEQGRAVVDAYMGHVQAQAESGVRSLLRGLSDGEARCVMDNGAQVTVAVSVNKATGCATIDFTGTSDQLSDNFNAPLPVVCAAVLYVVRTLAGGTVPMNEGCLRPIDIVVPPGSMLRPRAPAAVVAGNVETSQVVTDALFAAFGAMAGAQGTMNNLTFGNAEHQYYETIAGGAGAGIRADGTGFAGACAVQTHMTNSRLTDVEVLESSYPVLVERFAVRHGSGGDGLWRGGDGVVRSLRFLEPMEVGVLSNRRSVPPSGLAGGGPGQCGVNRLVHRDGSVEMLDACDRRDVAAGDVLIIETPGGGGSGEAVKRP